MENKMICPKAQSGECKSCFNGHGVEHEKTIDCNHDYTKYGGCPKCVPVEVEK